MNSWDVLADAADNLSPARMRMALSLGWHIIFACFGIALPLITVFTEWRGHRSGNAVLTELAHTWAKAMGVLFAAGAVSGTLLSFDLAQRAHAQRRPMIFSGMAGAFASATSSSGCAQGAG